MSSSQFLIHDNPSNLPFLSFIFVASLLLIALLAWRLLIKSSRVQKFKKRRSSEGERDRRTRPFAIRSRASMLKSSSCDDLKASRNAPGHSTCDSGRRIPHPLSQTRLPTAAKSNSQEMCEHELSAERTGLAESTSKQIPVA